MKIYCPYCESVEIIPLTEDEINNKEKIQYCLICGKNLKFKNERQNKKTETD